MRHVISLLCLLPANGLGGVVHRRDVRVEAVTGSPEPCAHCADGGVHHSGNVLIRVAMPHEQHQCSPFVEREPVQVPVEDAFGLLLQQEGFRGSSLAVRGPGRRYGMGGHARPGFAGFMPGDATQPGPERNRSGNARCLLPHHEHDIITYFTDECLIGEET